MAYSVIYIGLIYNIQYLLYRGAYFNKKGIALSIGPFVGVAYVLGWAVQERKVVKALLISDKVWQDTPVRNSALTKLFPVFVRNTIQSPDRQY